MRATFDEADGLRLSLFALASYIEAPSARLSTWQRTRDLRPVIDTSPGTLEVEAPKYRDTAAP